VPEYVVTDRRHSAGPAERRDPTVATTNTVFVSPGRPGVTDWNAERAIKFGYMSQIYVYRCVQKIATDIASLPFRVGADPDSPSDFNKKAPLARMLGPMPGKPNPQITAKTLIQHSVAMYLVTGRWAWEADRGGDNSRTSGPPLAFWPLPVWLLEPNPTNGGNEYFDGFTYYRRGRMGAGDGSTMVKLRNDQVVYAWKPSLLDPRQPESVLEAARLNVDVASMLDQYSSAFLRNNATPATAVVTEAWRTQDDRDQFQAQFNGAYGGVRNAGRTAFLEANGDGEKGVTGMFDIKPLGLTQRDAQFNEQMRQKISDICVAFGVPLSKLGDASGRTFSNADQEDENYWRDLLPIIGDMQDHINLNVAPQYSPSDVGWFDLSNVKALKPHRNLLPLSVAEAKNNDLITLEEAREYIGVIGKNPDITADDEARAQFASVGLSRLAAAIPALVAAKIISEKDAHDFLGLPGVVPDKPATPAPIPAVFGHPIPPADPLALNAPDPKPALPAGAPAVDANNQANDTANRAAPISPAPAGASSADEDWAVSFLRRTYEQQTRRLLTKQADSVKRWLSGKRGAQLVARAETERVTIYDGAFWADETRTWAADMYATAIDVAGRGLGATERATEAAANFITVRSTMLAIAVTNEVAATARSAYLAAVGDAFDHTEVVDAVDDALRQYIDAASVSIADREARLAYDGAREVLVRHDAAAFQLILAQLAEGDIDINAALAALGAQGATDDQD